MFPELAKLMAYKRISQTYLAKVIGITQQALSKKLIGKSEFKRSEMIKVKEYFSDICPGITMEQLFTKDIFLPK